MICKTMDEFRLVCRTKGYPWGTLSDMLERRTGVRFIKAYADRDGAIDAGGYGSVVAFFLQTYARLKGDSNG